MIMKKLRLTQDEICEYGRSCKLLDRLICLLEMIEQDGGELPEVLWDCTDDLADCLEDVKEKTLEYLRSKDKLVFHNIEHDNLSTTDSYPF